MIWFANLDAPTLTHRPYKFVLRLIEGLAFHSNNCSRFIPVYIKPYAEALELFPTFLIASKHTGYQIPKDIQKLTNFMLVKDEQFQTEEETANRQLYTSRMESVLKKFLEETHPGCNKDYCCKVLLSSILTYLCVT